MVLRGAERANPAVYEDLEPHRAQIRKVHGPLLWEVVASMRAPDLDEVARAVATDLFDRLAREALWAVTEIRKFDELKYLSQRYLSEAVWNRWTELAAAKVADKLRYYCDAEGHIDVRHEHVVPCQHLKGALANSNSLEETLGVLQQPVACVVSLQEDRELPRGGQGWERYSKRVRVFDRSVQDWADVEALAAMQR